MVCFRYDNIPDYVFTDGIPLLAESKTDGEKDKEGITEMKYPCKKQRVLAVLCCRSGDIFIGENSCENEVAECPRKDKKTGEGYALCLDVCGQRNHAERDAITQAGEAARGGVLYLFGHTYFCDACKRELDGREITGIIIPKHFS
jgi:deoxycytidylate deaminase